MIDIKMSNIFTDGEVMVTEWGDRYVLSDDFHLEIGGLHQLSAAAHAINTHDAMQVRIAELESLLRFTKDALLKDKAVIDTVWLNDCTTLYDQIELTLERAA